MDSQQDIRKSPVRLQRFTGPEHTQAGFTVIPVATSLTVTRTGAGRAAGGGGQGGGMFARAWPSAVLVSVDGRTSRLRIVDVTRLAQIAILLTAFLCMYELWTRNRTRTRKEWS